MKKLLALLFMTTLCLCCLISCDMFGKAEGLTYETYENCAVFTFDDFEGKATIKLDRTDLGEGAIYYQATLEEGAVCVKYEYAGVHELVELTADDEMPMNASGGYVEGNKIEITFEANSPVSGEIMIAFTEDALKAVHKDLQLHEHTFIFETTEDAHRLIYTCDCDWLGEQNYESHDDGDLNEYCDKCEYHIGIPHEHSSWYEMNRTSHRQVFECGCESPEDYQPHVDSDEDDWCDICGYGLLSAKEQLFIDNVIELAAKGESLTWSDFAQYQSIETGSGLYILVYEIDDIFQLIIGGSGNTEEPPMYIRLALKNDIDTYVDVRGGTTAVKAFYEANTN